MSFRSLHGLERFELGRPTLRSRGAPITFFDREGARRFLERLAPDPGTSERLRAALVEAGELSVHRLSDPQVIEQVADRLAVGALTVIEHGTATGLVHRDGWSRNGSHVDGTRSHGGGGGAPRNGAGAATPQDEEPPAPRPRRRFDPAPAPITPSTLPKPELMAPDPEPVTTEPETVVEPIRTDLAYRVETSALAFAHESSLLVPLAGDAATVPVLPLLTAMKFLQSNPQYGLAIVGHTSVSGSHAVNDALSERRALSIRLFLDDRRDDWIALADEFGRVKDYQALLAYFHRDHGWDCDPGSVDGQLGPNTRGALERFQAAYNPAFGQSIEVDGLIGPQTWGAFFDVLQDEWLMGLEINQLSLVDAKTYVDDAHRSIGAGERCHDHAELPADSGAASRRFVDLLLVPLAGEADLASGDVRAGLYDRFEIETIPIDVERPPADPPRDERYQVWVRAFDHFAKRVLVDCEYQLSGPLPGSDLQRQGVTDERGELREQDLACGDYRLEIAGGKAIVATRWQVEARADAGEELEGYEGWADAVRIGGASGGASAADLADVEPGGLIDDEDLGSLDWLWLEEDLASVHVPDCECECEDID